MTDADDVFLRVIPAERAVGGDVSVSEAVIVGEQGAGVIFRCFGVVKQVGKCGRGFGADGNGRFVVVEKRQRNEGCCGTLEERQQNFHVADEGGAKARTDGACLGFGGLGREVGVVGKTIENVSAQEVAADAVFFGSANEQARAGHGRGVTAVHGFLQFLHGGVVKQAAADQEVVEVDVLHFIAPLFSVFSMWFYVSLYTSLWV